jgi:hypothetical protein
MDKILFSGAYNQRGMAKVNKTIACAVHAINLDWLAKNIDNGQANVIKHAMAQFDAKGTINHKIDSAYSWHNGKEWKTLAAPAVSEKPSHQYAIINGLQYNKSLREAIAAVLHGEAVNDAAASLVTSQAKAKPTTPKLSAVDKIIQAIDAKTLPASDINKLMVALGLAKVLA